MFLTKHLNIFKSRDQRFLQLKCKHNSRRDLHLFWTSIKQKTIYSIDIFWTPLRNQSHHNFHSLHPLEVGKTSLGFFGYVDNNQIPFFTWTENRRLATSILFETSSLFPSKLILNFLDCSSTKPSNKQKAYMCVYIYIYILLLLMCNSSKLNLSPIPCSKAASKIQQKKVSLRS